MWKKCDVEKVCLVPKTAFYPVPKVDSIVLAFSREEKYEEVDDQIFLDFLKVVFREPRKTLQNNLLKGEYSKESILNAFTENKLAEKVRAEELT